MSPEGGGHDVCELPGHFSVALCLQLSSVAETVTWSSMSPMKWDYIIRVTCDGVISGHVQDVSGS